MYVRTLSLTSIIGRINFYDENEKNSPMNTTVVNFCSGTALYRYRTVLYSTLLHSTVRYSTRIMKFRFIFYLLGHAYRTNWKDSRITWSVTLQICDITGTVHYITEPSNARLFFVHTFIWTMTTPTTFWRLAGMSYVQVRVVRTTYPIIFYHLAHPISYDKPRLKMISDGHTLRSVHWNFLSAQFHIFPWTLQHQFSFILIDLVRHFILSLKKN